MSIQLRRVLVAVTAAGIFLAQSGIAGAAPFRLIVTDLEAPLVPNSVMELAIEEGYFEQEGVEVELVRVQQTPSAVAAILAGEGEMANIGLDALLQLQARGTTNLKAVVSPNKSLPFLIVAKDDIASPADLAGRSFGVGRVGSLDHSLSTKVLQSQGVDPGALEIVSLGQPNVRAQALAAGQIDATTVSVGVWLSLPEKQGLHVLIDQDAYYKAAPVVSKVNVVSDEVLAERRDEVKAVIRALIKASRDYASDPSRWAAAMEKLRADVPRATFDELSQNFAQSWSVNGGMNEEELTYSVDWLYEGADFAGLERVPMEQWADLSVLEEVLADLGTSQDMDMPAQ